VENTHQKIKEEVYRAKRLVDNYLLRGIEGREDLRYYFQPDDIGKLVIDCASRFHMTAARKGATIRIAAEVRTLPKIMMDRERIDQVLGNILDNAVKYSFDNTDIEVSANATKAHVSITITDYGLGIAREERDSIFQGYQRAVEDLGRFKPGTGLGLKIAKKIVDGHGGEIQVESVPWMADRRRLARHEGFRTSFRVVLPLGGPPKTSHPVFPGL
jgi:two-component system sensor histidine kinase VicK